MKKVAVVMAGGTGTRFWPLSREHRPKQLLSIGEHPVMLQATIERLEQGIETERILIVTSDAHADRIFDLETGLPDENIIVEPEGRDTAACSGVAAMITRERFGPDAVIGTFPADHRIAPNDAFTNYSNAAFRASSNLNAIVTFGVEPDFPSTGYGYILPGEESRTIDDHPFHEVDSFTEKPDRQRAMNYIEEDGALWNSGMFFWPASLILDEIKRFTPELHQGISRIRDQWLDKNDLEAALLDHYATLPEVSVDYAILENTDRCWTLPVDFNWNDLGSWESIESLFQSDAHGNVTNGDVILQDCSDNIIYEDGDVTIGCVGVENTVVVATDDAILVCPREKSQDVKHLVNELKRRDRDDLL